MTDPAQIAQSYLDLWNDADEASRRARLSDTWAADARYADPMMAGDGRDGIAEMITGARAQFPGHAFALTGTPDGHGQFARFSWALASSGSAPVARGTDVVRLDEAGQIAEVVGFLDGAE
jgi:hypothetical protein